MIETREHKLLRVVIVIALIFSVMTLSISYSAFSSYLEIRSKTTIENRSWLIQLQNVSEPIISGNASEVNQPVATSTNIVFDVKLATVGDEISYTFDISNNGTIDAKLSAIPTVDEISEELTGKIVFTITHEDGTAITANETLNAGETKYFKINIKYNALHSTNTDIDVTTTFLYVQQ